LREQPDKHASLRIAASSHALRGRIEKARALANRLHDLAPGLKVCNVEATLGPYRRPQDLAKIRDALRRGGVPG